MWAVLIFIILMMVLAYAGDLGKTYLPSVFGAPDETAAKKPVNSKAEPSYTGGKWQLSQKDGQVVATLAGENPAIKLPLPVLQVGCWDKKVFTYLQFSKPHANGVVPIQISFNGTAYQPGQLQTIGNYRSYFDEMPRYLTWFQQGKSMVIDFPEYGEILFDLPGLSTVQFPCLSRKVSK